MNIIEGKKQLFLHCEETRVLYRLDPLYYYLIQFYY